MVNERNTDATTQRHSWVFGGKEPPQPLKRRAPVHSITAPPQALVHTRTNCYELAVISLAPIVTMDFVRPFLPEAKGALPYYMLLV